jgi:hypothetical protein
VVVVGGFCFYGSGWVVVAQMKMNPKYAKKASENSRGGATFL